MKLASANIKNKVMLAVTSTCMAVVLFLALTGCYFQAIIVFSMFCIGGAFLYRYLGEVSDEIANNLHKYQGRRKESERMSMLGTITARLMHNFIERLAAVQNINNSIKDEVKYIFRHCEYDGRYYKVTKAMLELIENRTEMAKPEIIKMLGSVERIARAAKHISAKAEIPFLLSRLLEEVKKDSGYDKIRIENKLDKHLTIKLGERALYHALMYCVSNAIDEYRRLKITADSIDIIADMDEKYITIRVRDYGKGLDDKAKENIFTRIYSTKSEETNSGMSLCLLKMSINSIFEGEVWYEEPKDGQGAIFGLSISNDKIISGEIGGL